MEKNETFIGTCEAYTYDGLGVVHHNDFVFFVPRLIAGETAELSITKLKKRFGYARIVRLVEASEHRQEDICSVQKLCGGCQLLHMDYAEQKQFKEDKVKGCFRMNANMEIEPLPILTTEHLYHYRNKVQVPVQYNQKEVHMGFYKTHSNDIVDYDVCQVQTSLSNELTLSIKQWLNQFHAASQVRHVLVKHAHKTDQVMVCLVVRHTKFAGLNEIVERIIDAYPQVKSIVTIENRRSDNVILDGKETIVYGEATIEEELLDCRFAISAKSFYQINPYATELLYKTVIEYAELTGDQVLVDLYCGTGTIGIFAAKHCKKVYGIEIVKEAIEDAKNNAKRNNVSNIEFFVGDAGKGAQDLLRNNIKPDVVVVDPPRKGCDKNTLDAILKMHPKKLVYVSCDPATLARDCAYLIDNNYHIKKVQPCDMFPNTVHCEVVVSMSRAGSRL